MGKLFRKHRVWRSAERRAEHARTSWIRIFGRRSTAAFFVALVLFASAQITGYMLIEQRAQKRQLQSQELLPGGENGKKLNPDYKDPKVKPIELEPGAVEQVKAKPTEPQSAVTEAAKQTAVTSDPVQDYLDGKAANGGQPKALTNQEFKSERTANSYTYRNADGGKTKRLYAEPVNYQKDGAWKPIAGNLKDDAAYNKQAGTQTSALDKFMTCCSIIFALTSSV